MTHETTMTENDYMAIADTIRSTRIGNQLNDRARRVHNSALDCVAENLADRFETKDPNFHRAFFLFAADKSP